MYRGNKRWVTCLLRKNISGSLPAAWGEMPALEVVSLSGTRISGRLPHSWRRMSNLTTVGLAGTGVGGKLPGSWGGMTNLSWVDLRGTRVEGPPPWSWQSFCRGKKRHATFPSIAYLPWNVRLLVFAEDRREDCWPASSARVADLLMSAGRGGAGQRATTGASAQPVLPLAPAAAMAGALSFGWQPGAHYVTDMYLEAEEVCEKARRPEAVVAPLAVPSSSLCFC